MVDDDAAFGHHLFKGHRQLGERRVAMAGGSGYPARMTMLAPNRYAGHRFPPEIISHAVWLYFRFPLSLRMVEEMLAARGIVVSHEAVRQWALKFGQGFANEIRRRLPRAGDKWHLDEVVIKIAGTTHWLWRAVDQHGIVLDVLVQSRRDAKAAKRLLRKLLKRQGCAPRVMITDKLAELSRGKEGSPASGRASSAQEAEQPGRKLAPAHQATRAPDEAVQVREAGAAIPGRARADQGTSSISAVITSPR